MKTFGDAERCFFAFVREKGVDGFVIQKICSIAARENESSPAPDKAGPLPGWPKRDFISAYGDSQEITWLDGKFLA